MEGDIRLGSEGGLQTVSLVSNLELRMMDNPHKTTSKILNSSDVIHTGLPTSKGTT